jgi:TP901 family phage tail tape measure protein
MGEDKMSDKNITLGAVFTAKTDALETGLKRVQSLFQGFIKTVNDVELKVKSMAGGMNDRAFSSVQKSANSVAEALKKLEKQAESLGKKFDSIGKGEKPFRSLGGTVRQTVKDLGRFGSSSDDARSKFLDLSVKIASGYSLFRLLAGGVNEVIAAFKSGVKEMILFDQALKNIQAITRATDEEVVLMKGVILDVAASTKFSSVEISNGFQIMGQAGLSAAESMTAIKSTAMLAAGTLESMQMTTDLVTSTLRSFNLDASKTTMVADIFSNAINKSKLSVDKLRTALNYLGVNAYQSGLSLQETTALMSILADKGTAASTIGTGLRNVLAQAVKPGKALNEALRGSGLAIDALNPKVNSVNDVMKNLSTLLWDGEKQTVNMTKAFQLFGLRGASVGAALTDAFVKGGTWEKAMSNLSEVGSTSRMAGKQMEGLDLKFKNLADLSKNFAIAIGDAGVTGALHVFIDTIRKAVIAMTEFIQTGIGKFLFISGSLTTAMLIANATLFKLIPLVQSLSASFAVAGVRAGALSAILRINPFVLWITAATGLIIWLKKLNSENERLADQAKVQALDHNRLANALANYQKEIVSVNGNQQKYNEMIQRMILDHPELEKRLRGVTGAYDLQTVSMEKLTAAMEKLEAQEADKSIRSASESVNRFADELDKAESFLAGLSETSDMFAVLTEKDFKQAGDAVKTASNAYNDALRDMVLGLRDQVVTQRMSVAEVENFIQKSSKTPEIAGKISAAFQKAMAEIGQSTNKATVEMNQQQGKIISGISKSLSVMQGNLKTALKGMSALVSAAKEAADKVRETYQEIADLESDHYNDLRELRQATMTDTQKYYDDLAEAQKLLAEGQATGNRDTLQEARELYKSLSREVQDESGNTVKGIAETTEEAKRGVQAAYEAEKAVLQKQKAEREATLNEVRGKINELNSMVEGYGQRIAEISALGLNLDTKDAVKSLEKLKEQLGKAGEYYADIQIDTNDAQKNIGNVSESLVVFKNEVKDVPEVKLYTDKAMEAIDELSVKWMKLKADIAKGASADVSGKMGFAGGGQVPGSGDSDSVTSLLTPGEFVIRKSAVRAVGTNFLNYINSLQNAGRERITAAMERMQKYAQGGLVMPEFRFALPQMPSFAPVQHFAAGGPVMAAAGAPHYGTVNLTVGGSSYKMWSDEETARSLMRALTKEQRKKPNG